MDVVLEDALKLQAKLAKSKTNSQERTRVKVVGKPGKGSALVKVAKQKQDVVDPRAICKNSKAAPKDYALQLMEKERNKLKNKLKTLSGEEKDKAFTMMQKLTSKLNAVKRQ